MLSLHIKERMYLPHQIVTARGETGHEMFFVVRGQVEVSDNPFCKLHRPLSVRWNGNGNSRVALYGNRLWFT
jgi:hypothetical protein